MIIAAIINAAAGLPFLPQQLEASDWAVAIRAALIALLLFLPALIVVRETLRVGVGGTAVHLSEHQYPDLYQTAEDFARRIGLRRRPQIFLTQRQRGTQRVRRASDRPRLRRASNELFANLYDNNRNGLRFILGRELGHIRFHHVALWYQIAVAYSQRIPLLGPALSRLQEHSCDGQGAALSPQGATGLVLWPPAGTPRTSSILTNSCSKVGSCTASGWDSPSCPVTSVHGAPPGAPAPVGHVRDGRPRHHRPEWHRDP